MAAGLWSLFIACMYNMFCCLIQYWRGSGEVLYDGDYQRKESIGGNKVKRTTSCLRKAGSR